MDDILSSSDIQRFLRELTNRNVRYMVVGASAAALQGAGLVTIDVDLWFEDLTNPDLHEAALAVGGSYIPPSGLLPSRLGGKTLDSFDLVMAMSGLAKFEEEYRDAVWIESNGLRVPLLPLTRIIASKRAANRDKDRAVLPILEDVLKTINGWSEDKEK